MTINLVRSSIFLSMFTLLPFFCSLFILYSSLFVTFCYFLSSYLENFYLPFFLESSRLLRFFHFWLLFILFRYTSRFSHLYAFSKIYRALCSPHCFLISRVYHLISFHNIPTLFVASFFFFLMKLSVFAFSRVRLFPCWEVRNTRVSLGFFAFSKVCNFERFSDSNTFLISHFRALFSPSEIPRFSALLACISHFSNYSTLWFSPFDASASLNVSSLTFRSILYNFLSSCLRNSLFPDFISRNFLSFTLPPFSAVFQITQFSKVEFFCTFQDLSGTPGESRTFPMFLISSISLSRLFFEILLISSIFRVIGPRSLMYPICLQGSFHRS